MAAAHACEKLEGYDLQDNGKLRVQICSKEKIKQNEFANSSTFANLKSAASRYTNQQLGTQISSNPHATLGYPPKAVKRAKFKEVMCTNFLADGTCRFGEICSYKHGPDDMAGPIEPPIMMGNYVDSTVPYGGLGQ